MARYHPDAALIVVDLQNDFADPSGSLSVKGAERVIPAINREAAAAREGGALVVLTRTAPGAARRISPRTAGRGRSIACRHWGAELHPDAGDPRRARRAQGQQRRGRLLRVHDRDAPTGEQVPTMLAPLLQSAGVTDVVVTGLATDYCVKATALDACGSASRPRC